MSHSNNKPSLFFRICRRFIDYSLFLLVLTSFSAFLPPIFAEIPLLMLIVLLPVFFAPIEALLLSTWGKTLGMYACGITANDVLGRKLSFRNALRWSFRLGTDKKSVILKQKGSKVVAILASIACTAGLFSASSLMDYLNLNPVHHTVGGWTSFTCKEGGFTAEFPQTPQKTQRKLEVTQVRRTLNYDEFVSQPTPDVRYAVGYIDLPKKWGMFSSSTILKTAVKVIVESSFSAQLSGKSLITNHRYPTIDYKIKQGDEEIQGRMILVGTTLYKMEITYKPALVGEHVDLHQLAFFDSFKYQKTGKRLAPVVMEQSDDTPVQTISALQDAN